LGVLLSRSTRFLLIGGHAVAVHGEARYSEDLDVEGAEGHHRGGRGGGVSGGEPVVPGGERLQVAALQPAAVEGGEADAADHAS
jgi:hypothetical protein